VTHDLSRRPARLILTTEGNQEGHLIATAPPAATERTDFPLTDAQRAIVEHGEGPLVVIAGAGTGKTRVIVERVAHLLDTHAALQPEGLLVLTYNVKAARELRERIGERVGPATAARLSVSNFHSFCHRILTESAADADMPANPDVLDGVGQLLLLRDLRPKLELLYHSTTWHLPEFVKFINRAKDELVTPDEFDEFVAREQQIFEDRYGPYADAAERLVANGSLKPVRDVRGAYARERAAERAGEEPTGEAMKIADREARRMVSGDGSARRQRKDFPPEQHVAIDALADDYVRDGAALEVMRWREIAAVYRAYQEELTRRGALDFGEQIAAVTELFKRRPNVLRRWQRQFSHILVDEFQDANIAQIELIELLGRTPDRPDNVMVVGDDDQSIYRFRGASFAAFAEFDKRFSRAPRHDRNATPPGSPPRRRIEQNFRSVGRVLQAANRLIKRNLSRFEPDKQLWSDRPIGPEVEVVMCAGPEDEAVAIVDAIRDRLGDEPTWSDVAVLYRKHKHREAIVARLRDEDIPYTVVGGVSLFATPEIRDLEQALRAICNPHDDVALTRVMTAGPWRLDALEILNVTNVARFDDSRLYDVITRLAASAVDTSGTHEPEGSSGAVSPIDRPASSVSGASAQTSRSDMPDIPAESRQIDGSGAKMPIYRHADAPISPATNAKLRRLLTALDELHADVWREGPHTVLERYLELTGTVLDLLAAQTADAHRAVANVGSFLRFAADWQAAHPKGSLGQFADYLDAYQEAGGELPTSVELAEDVQGVRLMTLYQAKGLEYRHVVIPQLLENEWPTREGWSGYFPTELLREPIDGEGLHTEEERRLLYVAMTRAQDTLMLTTHGGPMAEKPASLFVNEILDGALGEVRVIDRANQWTAPEDAPESEADSTLALARRIMPMPTKRERRLELRRRAAELVGMIEGTSGDDPEDAAARAAFTQELGEVGERAGMSADASRAAGLDPVTLREIAGDSGMGSNLLEVVPLPPRFSYSAFSTYETCPTRYAFAYVYRIPEPSRPAAALTFGSTAHDAFEAFTKERRERQARGEPEPTREDLERLFRERWVPSEFGDRTTEEIYQRRVATLLDNFWTGEVSSIGEAIVEEQAFELVIEDPTGAPPVVVYGKIDRIDRLPSGKVEVIDYKTGKLSSQKDVHESLQLSIYALACRDALGLGTPERVTLYFTESATRMSTTRTDEELDAARADILARTAVIRSGDFAATPSAKECGRCAYARLCPSRI
jgi:superfamily I DNA/RNA helicase/RecB family exonuclease